MTPAELPGTAELPPRGFVVGDTVRVGRACKDRQYRGWVGAVVDVKKPTGVSKTGKEVHPWREGPILCRFFANTDGERHLWMQAGELDLLNGVGDA